MKKMKRAIAVLLLLCLTASFSACGSGAETPAPTEQAPATAAPTAAPTPSAAPKPTATPEPSEAPEEETPASGSDVPSVPLPASSSDLDLELNLSALDYDTPIRVQVMNGPTGFGMAKLIYDAGNGNTLLNYDIAVESDASNVTAALISGETDIAALPSNAASVVYNKTQGGIQTAAEIVRGNLFLMQDTEKQSVSSLADLKGKTVYAPAQNPTFILTWLCRQNGLQVGTDVVIDNSFAQPADLRTALAAGEVDLAVLPEPMATIARSANHAVDIALDLDAAWNAASDSGIVLGCLVVRTEWAKAHPAELSAFLLEYYDSVIYASASPESAAQLIEATGVFTNAAVALEALPRCALCFVTGGSMKREVGAYLAALAAVAPESIGGAVPGDDFYYLG